MEALSVEQTEQLRDIIYDHCRGYIPVQELSHVVNEISKEPTEDKVDEMFRYLYQPDKEYIADQTVNTKPIKDNQVRFAMSEARKLVLGMLETKGE